MPPLLISRLAGLMGCAAKPALSLLQAGGIICVLAGVVSAAGSPPATVVVWGASAVRTNQPAGLTNIAAIAAGGSHMLALKTEGAITAWGAGTNASGTNENYGQALVPNTATNIDAIAAGRYHSLALRAGHVLAWGAGTSNTISVPHYGQAIVPPAATNVASIAAGAFHSLALRSNGTVIAWGYSYYGETNTPPNLSNVIAVAGGGYHSLALKADGTVVAWGAGTNNTGATPASGQSVVPASASNVIAIAAGDFHSLALRADGTVVGWGDSSFGQASVPPGLSNVVGIAAGDFHSLALKADGTVVGWGKNNFGQAGSPDGLAAVVGVSGGQQYSAALTLAPVLVSKPPPSIALPAGQATNLLVDVLSSSPFTSQWSLNGAPLESATNTTLTIANFALAQAATYSIAISNQQSSVQANTVVRLTNSPVVLVDGVDVGGGSVTSYDSSLVTMSTTFSPGGHVYYSLDGSQPDFTAFPYTGPFLVTNSVIIRAVAFNQAYSDSAESAPIELQITPVYELLASSPGGGYVTASLSPFADSNFYPSNTVITLTATPSNGWTFLHWDGDASGGSNVIAITMDGPRVVAAIFGAALGLFTNGNGSVLLNPANGPYSFGSTVEISAVPATGSYFFGWANAASGNANPLQFNLTQPASITALFGLLKSNQVSLTVLPDLGGTVTISPNRIVYTNGDIVTLTALSTSNLVFTGWSGDAGGATNPLVLTLDNSKVINAAFMQRISTNPPIITQQPIDQVVGAGDNIVLAVQASGDGPLTYQWRFNGSPLAGRLQAALGLTNIQTAQVGVYDALVAGPAGTATSAPASIAIFGVQLIPSSLGSLPLLSLDGVPGTSYLLQFSNGLSPTNWNLLAPLTLNGTHSSFADIPTTNEPHRFYRAMPSGR